MDGSKEVDEVNGRYAEAGKAVYDYVDDTGKMLASQALGFAMGAVHGGHGGLGAEEPKIPLSESKKLLGQWAKDPVKNTRAASLRYHYRTHAQGVGATSMGQYMRKAEGFVQEIRAGRAKRSNLEGGKLRWTKNGRYIIVDRNGKIISFGKART